LFKAIFKRLPYLNFLEIKGVVWCIKSILKEGVSYLVRIIIEV